MELVDDRFLFSALRELAISEGLDDIGIASVDPLMNARRDLKDRKQRGLHGGMHFTYGNPERATSPADLLEGAESIVVALRRYDAPLSSARPGLASVAHYVARDEYGQLRSGLQAIASYLRTQGSAAEVVFDDNRLVDRAIAVRAGLGWIGKNSMLLNPELGSWTVIGSVVTDRQIVIESQDHSNGCGECRRCQVECPTGALDEEGVLDANKCLAWLVQAQGIFPVEFRVVLGDRLYGCDDCQTVCPVNDGKETVRIQATNRSRTVELVKLLQSTDDVLMKKYEHWYIPRRRAEYLRRNALVVLANVADGADSAVESVVFGGLKSDSAIVRAHAVWAARQLGLNHLFSQVGYESLTRDDPNRWVSNELEMMESA